MAAAPFQWSLAALETLMAEDQMDQHRNMLRAFSVVELWRLRRVCRAFHRWGTAALAALPRIVAVGGQVADYEPTAGVEVLDLSTLRWSSGAVPALLDVVHHMRGPAQRNAALALARVVKRPENLALLKALHGLDILNCYLKLK